MELPSALIDSLLRLVGPDHFSADSSVRDQLVRTTLPQGTYPAALIRPSDRAQVQAIIHLARAHAVPLYPISTGKNWGYGDASAPTEGCMILDLSRMNKILEVNTELAYAVIEPGVTQGQLAAYLQEHHIPLMLDGNGAGPDASLVGNILDRGFGHSRYGDRFLHCCNIEAVLSDGTVVNTGYGAYPNAQAQHVYKHGIGPSLDGLLTQSNIAIVTRMTIWLQPIPECMNFFFITLKKEKAIGPLMDRLRKLFLAGTLRTTLHCFNDRRLLASEIRFPWDQSDGTQALEKSHAELLQALYKKHKIPAWAASGSLSGSASEVAAMRKTLRRAMRGLPDLDKMIMLSDRSLSLIQTGSKMLGRVSFFQPIARLVEKVGIGVTLLKGIPSSLTLKGAHWRARGNAGSHEDPLESGAGLIWISPVVPMTGEALDALLKLSEPIFHEFGFEFQVTVSCLNERSLCAVMSICFDRASEKETRRAKECEKKLLGMLLAQGAVPYRASPSQQAMISALSPSSTLVPQRLKKAIDPQGIIAPRRYIP